MKRQISFDFLRRERTRIKIGVSCVFYSVSWLFHVCFMRVLQCFAVVESVVGAFSIQFCLRRHHDLPPLSHEPEHTEEDENTYNVGDAAAAAEDIHDDDHDDVDGNDDDDVANGDVSDDDDANDETGNADDDADDDEHDGDAAGTAWTTCS